MEQPSLHPQSKTVLQAFQKEKFIHKSLHTLHHQLYEANSDLITALMISNLVVEFYILRLHVDMEVHLGKSTSHNSHLIC